MLKRDFPLPEEKEISAEVLFAEMRTVYDQIKSTFYGEATKEALMILGCVDLSLFFNEEHQLEVYFHIPDTESFEDYDAGYYFNVEGLFAEEAEHLHDPNETIDVKKSRGASLRRLATSLIGIAELIER